MARVREKVPVYLDSGNIKKVTDEDVHAILRGADELIMTGGRTMLAKLLKGSKDKKIIEHHLDSSPAYGVFSHCTLEEISLMIDWCIQHDYLAIEYSGKLPFLVFTPKGWEIEKVTYTEELYQKIESIVTENDDTTQANLIETLKTRNRQVILLLLDKIATHGTENLIPFLEKWKQDEVKKVASRIGGTVMKIRERK